MYQIKLIFAPKSNEVKASYLKSKSITNFKLFFYPAIFKPIINFYKVLFKAKSGLSEITVPVGMVHSKGDEVTAFKSSLLFKKGLVNTTVTQTVITNSLHGYYTHDEQQTICDELLNFLKSCGTKLQN